MKKILFLCLMIFGFANFANAKDETILKSANAFAVVMRDNPNKAALVANAKAILIFPRCLMTR